MSVYASLSLCYAQHHIQVLHVLGSCRRNCLEGASWTTACSTDRARRNGQICVVQLFIPSQLYAESPLGFQEWVRRSKARYPDRPDDIRAKIKAVLSPLVDAGTWASHDWDREPMPVLDDSPRSSSVSTGDQRSMPRPGGGSRRRCSPDSVDDDICPAHKRHAPASRARPQSGKKGKKGNKQHSNKWVRNEQAAALADNSAAVSARAARFQSSASAGSARHDDDDDDWHPASDVIVQGRCQALEKDFLRLNGPPDSAKVRPEPVIKAALERLVGIIARDEHPYRYHWTQLKAMRQDLIVQHVQNETTAAVEEVFARRALEHGDMRDYQKCSTALRVLYDAGVQGYRAEFDAYRILANVCQDHCTSDEVLKSMTDAYAHSVGESAEVQHALAVQRALTMGNWRGFWRLYASAPNRGRLIMDRAAPGVRLAAARALASRFKPAASQAHCVSILGFDAALQHDAGAPLLPGCSAAVREDEARELGAEERAARCRACLELFKAVVSAAEGGGFELRAKENRAEVIVLPDEKDMKAHGHSEVKLTDFQKVSV
jgi:SAC3 family protein LENG8/THP3